MFWFAVELLMFLLLAGVIFFTVGWLLGWRFGRKNQSQPGVEAGDARLSLQEEFRTMLENHQEAFRVHHDRVMESLKIVRMGVKTNHQETVQRAQQVIDAMPAESNFEGALAGLAMPDYTASFSNMQKRVDSIKFEAPDYSSQFQEIQKQIDSLSFQAPDYSSQLSQLQQKVDSLDFQAPDYSAQLSELSQQVRALNFEAPDYTTEFAQMGEQVRALNFEAPDYSSKLAAIQNKVENIRFVAPDYSKNLEEISAQVRTVRDGVEASVTETKKQAQIVISAIPAPVKQVEAAQQDFDYKVVNNEIYAARREAQEQTDTILNALAKVKTSAPVIVEPQQANGDRRDYTILLTEISNQIQPLHGIVDEIEMLQQKYTDLTAKLSAASVVTDVDTRDIEDKLDHIYYILDGLGVKPARMERKPRAAKAIVRRKAAKTVTHKKASKPSSRKARRKMDDLKRISGIGRVIERKLKSNGVRTFRDIARWSGKDVVHFEDKLHFKGRINREKWVKQAKNLYKKAG